MARKTVWYKRATIGTLHNRTLQSALATALGKLNTTGQRLRRPNGNEDPAFELINGYANRYSMLCGNFIGFDQGHQQPFIKGLNTSKSFDLDTIAPPKGKPEERREFLQGVAYFAILDNHVLLVQSKTITSREFERYLNWILWEATTALPSATAVVLGDQPSKKLVEKLNNNPIKSVSLGTPLEYEPIPQSPGSRINEIKVRPSGVAASVLRSLFSESIFDSAKFSEAIASDNIEVEVTVRFKNKQHVSESGENLLRSVAKAARHMQSEDIAIELHKAGTLRGNDLRVHTAMELATTDKGLIKEDDLNQKMHIWLTELLETKMIDP